MVPAADCHKQLAKQPFSSVSYETGTSYLDNNDNNNKLDSVAFTAINNPTKGMLAGLSETRVINVDEDGLPPPHSFAMPFFMLSASGLPSGLTQKTLVLCYPAPVPSFPQVAVIFSVALGNQIPQAASQIALESKRATATIKTTTMKTKVTMRMMMMTIMMLLEMGHCTALLRR